MGRRSLVAAILISFSEQKTYKRNGIVAKLERGYEMTDLNGMSVFVAVAEAGSLTGAGNALNLPKSTISRRLQSYEESVGTTLFRRSTRSISLTDAGKRHFDRVQPVVKDAASAFHEIASESKEPTGLVRVSATVGMGQHFLAPLVYAFMNEFPKVRVELLLSERVVDLIGDGIDFAVRMGELEDSELLARKLRTTPRMIVATPGFLAAHSEPKLVQDLRKLPAVVVSPSLNIWQFANGEDVRVNWRFAGGNISVVRDACLAGQGIALLPEMMVKRQVASGRLAQLLEGVPPTEVATSIVYARQSIQSAATRAFLTALIKGR